jgi:hypothetical protein
MAPSDVLTPAAELQATDQQQPERDAANGVEKFDHSDTLVSAPKLQSVLHNLRYTCPVRR